jgi:serine/threonine protein kinase
VVKKAICRRTGNVVAIKTVDKIKHSAIIEQIKNEVSIMKLCQHSNIVKLLDVFETVSHIYIAMEYLPGGDLLTYFKNRKSKINEERVCQIVRQIVNALQYMKDRGIIHRDLKLENVLLVDGNDQSDVKIADFGLSSLTGPNQDSHERLGTLHYTAPEILSGKPYDASVDVWSLGVITYALLSGTFPFDSNDDNEEIK